MHIEESQPVFQGWVKQSSEAAMIDPRIHCLLSGFDLKNNQLSNLSFSQLLNDPHATAELSQVTEAGHGVAVVKLVTRNFEREIWFFQCNACRFGGEFSTAGRRSAWI